MFWVTKLSRGGGVERVHDDEGDASVCTMSLCVKGSTSVIIVINCLLTRHQAWTTPQSTY